MLPAIQNQWVQREIQDVAFDRQEEVEAGDRVIVGVNRFEVEDEEREVDLETVSEAEERKQVERLESVREERDDEAVADALATLRDAARGDDNLMPPLVGAVEAYATVGEVCDALRDVFGEHQPGA
jgi:methylmalonyl-CoA mutase N-terminal domain/subunit